jgi:putative nucleotidyltransferase with HDIG domain
VAHLLDAAGVFSATVIGAIVYRRSGSLTRVLAPIEAVTPLRAIEFGMDPLVRRFVALLDEKDENTRDHVVRTAHLAAAVAEELRLSHRDLVTVSLGAFLHDIGKLEVPDAILQKPGDLTPDEFATIRGHAAAEDRLVRSSPALAELGPVVRGHHERFDGGGYPDGLVGDAIPIGARIVAVCDAYDAMANTRAYRQGLGSDRALSVLSEHAGAQWDPAVVAAALAVVRRRSGEFGNDAFTAVGRERLRSVGEAWCGCAEALPKTLVEPMPVDAG